MPEFNARSTFQRFSKLSLGLAAGVAITLLSGCELQDLLDKALEDLEECKAQLEDKYTCDVDAKLELGKSSITGIASIDAFFGAALDVQATALELDASIRAELDAIALSVGLEAGAKPADIEIAVKAKIAAHVKDATFKLDYQPARCEASLEVTASAAAECDVEIEPGMVEVACQGSCEVEASADISCEAEATLVCEGPRLDCKGEGFSCKGNCELEGGGTCEGICRGECSSGCSVRNAAGHCAGACEGECTGTCELKAGASCAGSCEGSCEWESGSGCEGAASAKCEAKAEASIQCSGRCEGEVTPPSVSAECEASVEAKASASMQCTPPEIAISFQWHASVEADVEAQAAFKAWMGTVKGHLSVIFAADTKAQLVVKAMGKLGASGKAAIDDVVASFDASGDASLAIKAACAVPEVPKAAELIASASTKLEASMSAAANISTAFDPKYRERRSN